MKLLRFAQKIASYAGITEEQSIQKNLFNRQNVSALVVLSSSTASSLVFLLHDANTFTEYNYSVAAFSSLLIATLIFAVIVWKMKELFYCLSLMENRGVNPRLKYPESRLLFDELDPKVEKWTEYIYFVISNVLQPLAMGSIFAVSYFMYFCSDSGNSAFEVIPLPFWLPFDWKNSIGFLFAFALLCITMFYVNLVISVSLCTGVGIYMWSMTFLKDIKNNLKAINKIAGHKKRRENFLKEFFDTIHYHTVAIETLDYGSNVGQPIFMLLITWGITTICGALLIVNHEISQNESSNWIVFLITIVELKWSFGLVFISCELCGRVSCEFDDIDHIIGQFKWYLFPYDVQQILPFVIINAHQEVAFQCFGSAMCNRVLFKEVVNHSYSYFMVLKKF